MNAFSMKGQHKEREARSAWRLLFRHYGPQHWWPAQSRLEVILGAYLTQNTNWGNVEKAIANLRRERRLHWPGLRSLSRKKTEELIRPSGYFRQKASRFRRFMNHLEKRYAGSLDKMFVRPTDSLRSELLALPGVGKETADSILLYGGGHPIFVVDVYTRRIVERHGWFPEATKAEYDELREWIEHSLDGLALEFGDRHDPRHPPGRMSRSKPAGAAGTYNELHAMIVRVGSSHCRARPKCDGCPLASLLPEGGPRPLAVNRDRRYKSPAKRI